MSRTVYDVAADGKIIGRGVSKAEADELRASTPGCQLRTRTETKTVPAAFAVFVDGRQVGKPMTDAGKAAREAHRLRGQVKLVPA